MIPSAVRRTRRERLSICAGAGWTYEHERQHNHVRLIVGQEPDGRAILVRRTRPRHTDCCDTSAIRQTRLELKTVFGAGSSLLPRYANHS